MQDSSEFLSEQINRIVGGGHDPMPDHPEFLRREFGLLRHFGVGSALAESMAKGVPDWSMFHGVGDNKRRPNDMVGDLVKMVMQIQEECEEAIANEAQVSNA